MYPEQNQFEPTNGMEYLDQISTKPPSKFSFINKKILIGAATFIVLLVILLVVNAVTSNRSTGVSETLSAQLSSLSTLIEYGEKNDVGTRQVIAESSLILTSSQNQLSSVVSLPKPSKEAIARENVAGTTTALDSARSTGNLSGKYIAATISKIDEILLSLEKLLDNANSSTKRQTVSDVIDNFTELRNRFGNA